MSDQVDIAQEKVRSVPRANGNPWSQARGATVAAGRPLSSARRPAGERTTSAARARGSEARDLRSIRTVLGVPGLVTFYVGKSPRTGLTVCPPAPPAPIVPSGGRNCWFVGLEDGARDSRQRGVRSTGGAHSSPQLRRCPRCSHSACSPRQRERSILSTTTVTDNASSIATGGTLVFTATVKPDDTSGTPAGTIDWCGVVCSSSTTTLDNLGQATCSINNAQANTSYNATASFIDGDGLFSDSTVTSGPVSPNRAPRPRR